MNCIYILLALISVAWAVPKHGNRIVGGEPVAIEQYPFTSSMLYSYWGTNFRQSCGGTLVTRNAIVSAAHCYIGDASFQWRVRLGSSYASSGGDLHAVSRLVLHENYNPSELTNDIAIVKLSTNAVLSASIGLARVAGPNYNLNDGSLVYATGWGTTGSGGWPSEVLRHVGLNVINQQLCADRYAFLKTQPNFEDWPDITPEMICAGILDVGGKDTCQGDSGGPLLHQTDIIVGVTSWGFSCGDSFYPGVSARVSSYASWISENA